MAIAGANSCAMAVVLLIATVTILGALFVPAYAEEAHQGHEQQHHDQQHQQHQQQQQQHQQLHERMDDLVGSVKDAVKDVDAAADKNQVVDLGQSLHLLETKFSTLRAALAEEFGVSKEKLHAHTTSANTLLDKSTELVRTVVDQREDLKKLSGDMKEIDSAIRALQEGLRTFDREVSQLNRLISDVHDTHREITSTHDQIRSRMNIFAVDSLRRSRNQIPAARWLLIISIVEIAVVAGYIFYKRSPSRPGARKAYGKFG